mgnify:CR=1 FL=1
MLSAMSFLGRIFGRNNLQITEKLEKKIDSIRGKSKASFLALVGLTGKIKGLNVATSVNDSSELEENEIKRLCAKIAEAYIRSKMLKLRSGDETNLSYIQFRYTDSKSYWIFPLYPSEEFAIIAQEANPFKIIDRLSDVTDILEQFEEERRG